MSSLLIAWQHPMGNDFQTCLQPVKRGNNCNHVYMYCSLIAICRFWSYSMVEDHWQHLLKEHFVYKRPWLWLVFFSFHRNLHTSSFIRWPLTRTWRFFTVLDMCMVGWCMCSRRHDKVKCYSLRVVCAYIRRTRKLKSNSNLGYNHIHEPSLDDGYTWLFMDTVVLKSLAYLFFAEAMVIRRKTCHLGYDAPTGNQTPFRSPPCGCIFPPSPP